MQELTAAIRGGWHDWWRLRTPLLRRSGVWPTKASSSIGLVQNWWADGRSGGPRYSRLLELGTTQQSSVWAAVARSADDISQMVVLKGVGKERAGDGEAIQRLIDEARLTARMNHPNVVAMQGLLREGTRPVIVLEYLAGQSLATLLASANDLREFSLELRLAIVARLLRGLDYVHRLRDFDGRPLRVVHGNVSPDNVVVTYDGEVKLIDFGRARVRASALDDPLARRRLPYAPPEQFSGAPDLRGDIFSVGVILWELVANRPLWGRIPTPTLVRRLLAGDIPRLRDVVPTVDGELDRICARALAPHPEGRFHSAADLRGELEHYLAVRQAFVADSAIGVLVCNACRDLRRVAQKTLDARIGELGLSLPPAKLPALSTPPSPSPVALERRQRTVAASIVAAAILVAAVLWVTLRREPGPNAAEAAARVEALSGGAHVIGPDEAAAGDARRLVQLELSVRPPHAILSIDGRRLSSNPLQATMVWDSQVHTVRAEADGYEPFTTTFRLDSDVTIDAVLRPKPAGAVRSENASDERVVLRPKDELHARRRR
jgi:serine/threonine protein kinase